MSARRGSGERWRRRVAGVVLRLFLGGRERRQVIADLEELRAHRHRAGSRAAGARWWWDLVRFPFALVFQRLTGTAATVSEGAGPGAVVGAVGYDARHAIRRLVRNWPYTVSVLATLTVTIGAATAVFGALNGVLLRPLPHPEPDRLVRLYEVDRRAADVEDRNPVSVANYRDWVELNTTLESLAAFSRFDATVVIGGEPERVPLALITADFLDVLGVDPVLGRAFTREEYERGNDNVVLLGYDYWQRRFGGDPAVLDRVMEYSGVELAVVGVLPRGFRFLETELDVWSPWTFSESALQNRRSHYLSVIGRLKPGVSLERAQADMERVVDLLRPENREFLEGWGVNVVRLMDDIVGTARPALLLLFAAVGFVVLLGAVNVAALTLTRLLDTSHESEVRRAIGATRGRLIRERLIEGVLLALAGGAAGIGMAVAATRGLVAIAPASLPRADAIGVAPLVLAFGVVVSLAMVLSGTVAGFRTPGSGLLVGLRETGRSMTGSRTRRRWQALFIGSQIALSLTLLVSAGLMIRSLARLMDVDPGFETQAAITMRVQLPGGRYPAAPEQAPVLDALLDSALAVPGVAVAGITNYLPFVDGEGTWSVQIVGQPERRPDEKRDYGMHLISPGYFDAMGIAIVRGRGITEEDRAGRPLVTVVNEAFVRRFFGPDEDPIGRRMHLIARPDEIYEIVGVIGDVHHSSLDAAPAAAYYLAYRQLPDYFWIGASRLVVQPGASGAAVAGRIRDAARALDPGILVYDTRTMADRIASSASVARTRFVSLLLAGFAAVALALTAIGVGGAVTQWIRQRRREIGIRMTMGATPGGVIGSLVKESGRIVAAGLLAGLLGAAALARVQSALLFGVTPMDARTYIIAALLVAAGALIATLLPAARAGRTDPVAVLRSEG